MPRPTITVAIPSYNKETQIRRCIESALKNKDEIDDIILVDNCSTDRTFEIAMEYTPEITCVQNQSNLGMSGNFNRCIELCKTDWLMILHADDELLPDVIRHYRNTIHDHPSIGLVHADCYFQPEGSEEKNIINRSTYGFYTAGADARSCQFGACSSVMVKMSAYEELGKFTESMSTDVEMWSRVASKFDIYSLDLPSVIYHVSTESTGQRSLVDRTVAEIKADWDGLNKKILANISDESEREQRRLQMELDASGNYWPVLTANLRAKNWSNVAAVLKVIIVDHRGLFTLIRLSSRYLINAVKRFFSV